MSSDISIRAQENAISFTDPAVQRCPFPAYREVRPKGPVYKDPSNGFFVVTAYDLVLKVAMDPYTFSNISGQVMVQNLPYQDELNAIYERDGVAPVNALSVTDPPEHGFYRSLVDKAFTPSRIKTMGNYLAQLADQLIDKFIADGECDFYSQFAMRLPVYVIADQLGVPKTDFDRFRKWSHASVKISGQSNTKEDNLQCVREICELQKYIVQRADEYRRAPRDCMLSDLVHADSGGRKLTEPEIVSIVQQILVAGNETTVSMLSGALLRIIQTDGLESELRENPARMANFIEEALRIDSPIQGLYRRATKDTEIGGVAIPAESIVVIKWGGANHDPAKFNEPEKFDIDRRNLRQHISFGAGPHFCIGSQLARAELDAAFRRLLARIRNIRVSEEPNSIEYIAHYWVYGINRLNIKFQSNPTALV